MELRIPVRDAMITNVITISPDKTLVDAAKQMIKRDVGSLVVMEAENPTGIITEKNVTRLVAKGKNPNEVSVKDAMSSPLITVSPEVSIMDAAKVMAKNKLRKLPVLENDNLVGILTAEDIARVAPQEIELLLELAALKASEGIGEFKTDSTEGECETCGNYSANLTQAGGSYLCNECIAAIEN